MGPKRKAEVSDTDSQVEGGAAESQQNLDLHCLVRLLSKDAKIPLSRAMVLAAILIKNDLAAPQKIIAAKELKNFVPNVAELKALQRACRAINAHGTLTPKKAKKLELFEHDRTVVVDPKLKIKINRAPYLLVFSFRLLLHITTLDSPSALSVAHAVMAQSAARKAASIGLTPGLVDARGLIGTSVNSFVPLMGRKVPVLRSEAEHRCRALDLDKLADVGGIATHNPEESWKYLSRSFGKNLSQVICALDAVFSSYKASSEQGIKTEVSELSANDEETNKVLDASAWMIYIRTRPVVMDGQAGWGQKNELDLGTLLKEARSKNSRADIGSSAGALDVELSKYEEELKDEDFLQLVKSESIENLGPS